MNEKTLSFIEKSNKKHNNFYDYSLVNYIGSHKKVKIICPKHGIFEQIAILHYLKGYGCPDCANKPRYTTEKFITRLISIYKDKYDYSLVNYQGNKVKIKLICPIHGIFEIRPDSIISRHTNCPKCSSKLNGKNKRIPLDDYIQRANLIHNFRYDYSFVVLESIEDIVKIKCPEHGIFEQNFNNHLQGFGCKECSNNISAGERQLTSFIKEIYDNKVILNDRNIIKPKEIDIFLPELNLGFEYDGEYWHKLREEQNPGYHQLKDNLCSAKGIDLIHISDKDWMKNKDTIKKFIIKTLDERKNT